MIITQLIGVYCVASLLFTLPYIVRYVRVTWQEKMKARMSALRT